jgi:hypothetical protein
LEQEQAGRLIPAEAARWLLRELSSVECPPRIAGFFRLLCDTSLAGNVTSAKIYIPLLLNVGGAVCFFIVLR